ncbi:YidB family protein [Methylobacterium sp. J-070]|uniref:YidB family protein n=1 Tax=Methylobacterium sp. J-070 TaxID=2836650 RepID=UPI001FBAA86C|nr:YidB family protein [Methylobacterium sp. J-070]MCJ2050436.1 YidB family protein [Methylobacterium sp. J-070]
MSKGYPSMTALLGLLAVAGYQNRDKITEWLGTPARDAHGSVVPPVARTAPVTGSAIPSNLERVLGGVGSAGVGGLIASGLAELVEHFTKGGHGDTANSWVSPGANRDIAEADLERAIGPATLDHLAQQTGLGRSEILSRLSRELPSAIDRYATDGRRFA